MSVQKMSPKEAVLSFVHAINQENFDAARMLAHNNMSFEGVLGARQGADAYMQDMERMRLKYDLKKVFAEGDDVCLLYDLSISGQKVFCCGWYKVQEGKIISLQVVFDPRPLLEMSAKK